MAKKKKISKTTRASIIFWIIVFVLYAAILGPLIPRIKEWPLWIRVILIMFLVVLPTLGQVAIIDSHQEKKKK